MLAFITFLLAFITLPDGLSQDRYIDLSEDVAYLGAEISEEANVGEAFEVALYFEAEELDRDVQIFVHVESEQSECRLVRDLRPRIEEGGVAQTVTFNLPDNEDTECTPQRMEVFAGLYHRDNGQRLIVDDPLSGDNRIHAGHFRIVESGATEESRVFSPAKVRRDRLLSILRPWRYWGLGGLIGVILTAVFWRRRALDPEDGEVAETPSDRRKRWWKRPMVAIPLLVTAAVFIANILVALEFVKDDAYITFRIAHNFVHGEGLVFNTGDKLEGMTTFLWVFVVAPFEALGLDLFQVFAVVGTLFGLGAMVTTSLVSVDVNGAEKHMAHAWAALWLATSSSMAQWTTSGMEQPLGAFLPILALWLTYQAFERDSHKWGLAGGVIMGLACLTRPEIHLIGMILGVPVLWHSVKARKLEKLTLWWIVGLLGVTAPAHGFRYLYYGQLMPNTYYVKTGGSWVVALQGMRKLHDMFDFNNLGWVVMLTPFAFADRKKLGMKLVMAAVALGFMAYVVKVGADEMRWHRLYLPALPFLLTLGALGARNIVTLLAKVFKGATPTKWAPAALMILALGYTTQNNFRFTHDEFNGFNGWADLSGNFHPDIGKFVVRHEQPGGLVAFQDMGSTPYHAPDINFLDFIGLVDGTVARARHDYGLHAFVSSQSAHNQPLFDADMREYFYERDPEWVVLTSYVHGNHAAVAERFDRNPVPESIGRPVSSNGYQFGIYDDRFREHYVHVRTWPRSASYYLSLFRRADLWEQIPREVVFESVPEQVNGPTATFERGLRMLGAEVQAEAIEKQEFFVTTWWAPEGPAEEDTYVFLHIEQDDVRLPADHIPGDWMYPADRWRAGDIIEDRTLVQIPPHIPPGEYTVYLGLYRRSTGDRWQIVEGDNDGGNRTVIGHLTIRSWRPFLDQMIAPPDVDVQRAHPDRITPHGRARGE